MTGDLGELLNGFNRMATQLENCDEAIELQRRSNKARISNSYYG